MLSESGQLPVVLAVGDRCPLANFGQAMMKLFPPSNKEYTIENDYLLNKLKINGVLEFCYVLQIETRYYTAETLLVGIAAGALQAVVGQIPTWAAVAKSPKCICSWDIQALFLVLSNFFKFSDAPLASRNGVVPDTEARLGRLLEVGSRLFVESPGENSIGNGEESDPTLEPCLAQPSSAVDDKDESQDECVLGPSDAVKCAIRAVVIEQSVHASVSLIHSKDAVSLNKEVYDWSFTNGFEVVEMPLSPIPSVVHPDSPHSIVEQSKLNAIELPESTDKVVAPDDCQCGVQRVAAVGDITSNASCGDCSGGRENIQPQRKRKGLLTMDGDAEYVTGLERIVESLECHIWPNMRRTSDAAKTPTKVKHAAGKSRNSDSRVQFSTNGDDETFVVPEVEEEELERLLVEMSGLRENGSNFPNWKDKRAHAESLILRLTQMLDDSEESTDNDTQNEEPTTNVLTDVSPGSCAL